MECQICASKELETIYSVPKVPLFQNKICRSRSEAIEAKTASVRLVHCKCCDFVYNTKFCQELMNYDSNYQNEQAESEVFDKHLDNVVNTIFKYEFASLITELISIADFLFALSDTNIKSSFFSHGFFLFILSINNFPFIWSYSC